MALLLSFWLLSAFIVHNSIFSINAKRSFVRSSENASCPSQPCLPLNDYARESNQYFLDNTTFIFLPGIHRLDIQLRLKNVSSVAFITVFDEQQDDTVRVFLSPSVNITLTDCDNIEISGLVFVLSGHSEEELFSGLVLQRTTSVFLAHLTLFGNGSLQSTAIFLSDSSQITIYNVKVSGATSTDGSVLYALNSTIAFLGQNIFVNNTATDAGGAIVLNHCTSNFTGNISFVNNTASRGGAIVFMGGSYYILGDISFVNNKAIQDTASNQATVPAASSIGNGGAILAFFNSELTFETTSLSLIHI